MARKKKKRRNLNSELKNHQNTLKSQSDLESRLEEGIETSVVDQYAAPNVGDFLHSDIPETKEEEKLGLENTSVQSNDYLERKTVGEPEAEGNVEAETDAAVADGKDAPHPAETVGEELQQDKTTPKKEVKTGVETSVVDQYAAPNAGDFLHSDIPETQAEANRGLENTSVQSNDYLEGETIVQPVAEGDAEAETDAAVADGKTVPHPAETVGEEETTPSAKSSDKPSVKVQPQKGVSTSVINQYGAPSEGDFLHSDIPETQAEANRGLENTSVQSDDYLEGDTIVQWVAEGDAEAQTDAAVADGKTVPHPAQTVGEEATDSVPAQKEAKVESKAPQKGVSTSVINQYGAPSEGDFLHSDIPETQAEANRGLENTTVQSDDYLEGDTIVQWVAEGDAEAQTDAAVADGKTIPHPAQTVGEEATDYVSTQKEVKVQNKAPQKGVSTSVINQYGAPSEGDFLHSDIPETQAEANRGLENTTVQSDDYLEGDTIVQWVAEGDAEAQTDAAVADGKTIPHPAQTVGEEQTGTVVPETTPKAQQKGVSTSVVNQYGAPNMGDFLHSDIPETQAEANRGLENTTVQSNDYLEGDTIVQWVAEGDAEAQTDAAVAAGQTKPHPAQTVGEEQTAQTSTVASEAAPKAQQKGVSTSVVNQYGAPNMGDFLHSDIPETQAEANRGLENTTVQSNDYLEGDTIVQWVAEGDAEAQTDAAVAAGKTKPHPAQTVGEEQTAQTSTVAPEAAPKAQQKGVSTSVVNQYGAPNMGDFLHSDIPETQAQADRGLENTTVQSNDYLEGDTIVQWVAEGNAEAQTDAAVAAGKTKPHPAQTVGEEISGQYAQESELSPKPYNPQKGVSTSVVNQYGAPNMGDFLHSDIPETQAQADRGLENTTVQSNDYLEGDTIVQWVAEGDAEAQTDAAVAAGLTKPHPAKTVGEENEDLPEDMKLSPEEVNKLFADPNKDVVLEIQVDDASISVEEPKDENTKYNALNHSVEKDLPIYLL